MNRDDAPQDLALLLRRRPRPQPRHRPVRASATCDRTASRSARSTRPAPRGDGRRARRCLADASAPAATVEAARRGGLAARPPSTPRSPIAAGSERARAATPTTATAAAARGAPPPPSTPTSPNAATRLDARRRSAPRARSVQEHVVATPPSSVRALAAARAAVDVDAARRRRSWSHVGTSSSPSPALLPPPERRARRPACRRRPRGARPSVLQGSTGRAAPPSRPNLARGRVPARRASLSDGRSSSRTRADRMAAAPRGLGLHAARESWGSCASPRRTAAATGAPAASRSGWRADAPPRPDRDHAAVDGPPRLAWSLAIADHAAQPAASVHARTLRVAARVTALREIAGIDLRPASDSAPPAACSPPTEHGRTVAVALGALIEGPAALARRVAALLAFADRMTAGRSLAPGRPPGGCRGVPRRRSPRSALRRRTAAAAFCLAHRAWDSRARRGRRRQDRHLVRVARRAPIIGRRPAPPPRSDAAMRREEGNGAAAA